MRKTNCYSRRKPVTGRSQMSSTANAGIIACALSSLKGCAFAALFAFAAHGQALRTENFDREPNWEGINNRSTAFPVRPVTQDFGYDPSGRIGGMLHPAG